MEDLRSVNVASANVHKGRYVSNPKGTVYAMANLPLNMPRWTLRAGYVSVGNGFAHQVQRTGAMAVIVKGRSVFGAAPVKMANANVDSSQFLMIPNNMPVRMAKSFATSTTAVTAARSNANRANNAMMGHAFYNL